MSLHTNNTLARRYFDLTEVLPVGLSDGSVRWRLQYWCG